MLLHLIYSVSTDAFQRLLTGFQLADVFVIRAKSANIPRDLFI